MRARWGRWAPWAGKTVQELQDLGRSFSSETLKLPSAPDGGGRVFALASPHAVARAPPGASPRGTAIAAVHAELKKSEAPAPHSRGVHPGVPKPTAEQQQQQQQQQQTETPPAQQTAAEQSAVTVQS